MMHVKKKNLAKVYILLLANLWIPIPTHANDQTKNRISITSSHMYQAYTIQTQQPVVVKFWAPWCTTCQKINPLFEEISANKAFAHITFIDINIEALPELIDEQGIEIIPTFQFIEHGRKIATDMIGVKNIDLFAQEFENLIKKNFEIDSKNSIDTKKNSATALMQWQNSLFSAGKTVSYSLRFWTRNAFEKTISCTIYMLDCLKERINAFLC